LPSAKHLPWFGELKQHARAAMARYAGLEMGGTKTIAVLGRPGDIEERIEFPTTTPGGTLERAVNVLQRWHSAEPIQALGVGSFGPVQLAALASDYGTILNTPKPGWAGARVVEILRATYTGPIALDTDVNAAALAEHRLGAAKGCGSLVYLTIGTGVGGGILIDGRPVHGALHPEIGHLRLRRAPKDTFPGACVYHGGCAEGLLSGPALEARFGSAPGNVPPEDWRWRLVASDLAELLANLLLGLSPERIIVGGGVTLRQPGLLAAAVEQVPERLGGYLGDVSVAQLQSRIVIPLLGNDAGPNGSLCLAEAAFEQSRSEG
jgi:fructokinase